MKRFLKLDEAEMMSILKRASCGDLATLVKQLGVCSNEGSMIIFRMCLECLEDESKKEDGLNLLLNLYQF